MTTINDVNDLARILREQPEWMDTLRGLLLTRELLDLPERFADFVKLTDANFRLVNQRLENLETDVAEVKTEVKKINHRLDGVETNVAELKSDMVEVKADVAELKTEVKQINGRLDNGFGFNYELKTEKNLRSIAGQFLSLRSVQVLRGAQSNQDAELAEQTEQAAAQGVITWNEHAELWQADLIFTGRSRNDDTPEYVVAEVSITAGDADVNRAVSRAEILSKVVNRPVKPVVIAANIDAPRRQLAGEKE